MTSHRSRNLVKLCLEAEKQDADTKQHENQAVQESTIPSHITPLIPVQIEFLDQLNIISDSLHISNIETSVTDNIPLILHKYMQTLKKF